MDDPTSTDPQPAGEFPPIEEGIIGGPFASFEDLNAPIPESLLSELKCEFDDLKRRDRKIPGLEQKLIEASFRVQEIRNSIAFREKILRRHAVKIIRERHGVKVIPGHNDPNTAYRRDIARIPKNIKALLAEMNVTLPTEFVPKSYEGKQTPPHSQG